MELLEKIREKLGDEMDNEDYVRLKNKGKLEVNIDEQINMMNNVQLIERIEVALGDIINGR